MDRSQYLKKTKVYKSKVRRRCKAVQTWKDVRKALDVSKVEDRAFLSIGFDMEELEDNIEISMIGYMK